MATHCQTAVRSRSGERQNLGTVNSFEGKQNGWAGVGQLQTKNLTWVVTCKMCLFSIYIVKKQHNIYYMKGFVVEFESLLYI